jgi:hypothetical protein
MSSHREIVQERPDLIDAHVLRVALVMKENVAPDPVQVLLLGPIAIVLQPQALANPIEESRLLRWTHASSIGVPIAT